MEPERRPIDAEYRLVRGPWPHWVLQLGLVKLALWTAAVVGALMTVSAVIIVALGWLRS